MRRDLPRAARKRLAQGAALDVAVLALALAPACFESPRVLDPSAPLRVASVNTFAVNLEFAESVDRSSAELVTHYRIQRDGSNVPITSVVLSDTLYGRVVQLLIAAGLPDSATVQVTSTDVLDIWGRSTGRRQATLRTGLNYGTLRPLFAAHCDACHNAAQPGGNYRTDSYAALFGPGSNTIPNLIRGDPRCLLVTRTKPGNSMFNLGNLDSFDHDLIRNWIVEYQARP